MSKNITYDNNESNQRTKKCKSSNSMLIKERKRMTEENFVEHLNFSSLCCVKVHMWTKMFILIHFSAILCTIYLLMVPMVIHPTNMAAEFNIGN